MQTEIERLERQGHKGLETVGTILDGPKQATTPASFTPAALEGSPPIPPAGIYFGMSDETYHAIPALSNSGIKKLAASPMIFWASTPWLSEKKRRQVAEAADEKTHQIFGRAYHCRLMEGAEAFAQRFAVELDPADYPDALVSTDQIKAAIARHVERVPVKPCGAKRDDLAAQLEKLRDENPPESGIVVGLAFTDGLKVDELKERIREYMVEQPVKPIAKVTDQMPDGSDYERAAVKADWIDQLLELEPDAQVFAMLAKEHAASHQGKVFLSAEQHMELEIAAAMVERDPEIKDTFRDGHAEVVLIWTCPTTGVPMKAKVDYLKQGEMIDLKSIANQRELSIENCLRFAIGSYKYNIQPIVYFEGAQEVRKLVRQRGHEAVFVCGDPEAEISEQVIWAMNWAKHKGPDDWLWVFQQKGDAPITRGVRFPRGGMVDEDTTAIVDWTKKRFLRFSEVFGTAPWLDTAPVYTIDDESVPRSATEI